MPNRDLLNKFIFVSSRVHYMQNPLRFESKRRPIASPAKFRARLWYSTVWAVGIVVVALAIGMAGYMWFEAMGTIDAFANAAMILSGMGPLTPLLTDGGKIFAGFYALFSGLLIFAVAGLILAPVFHRILHSFHVADNDPKN
jgi:hypothetical protein